ncbi:MAG: hypothetical protein QOH91_1609 [Mycobacterium sp.]|jgi:hypothetical protein|nr:hypothetical protein [Mycobacterium sp.]
MKSATVKKRRRLADGRKLIQVVCPVCSHRHWTQDAATGFCSRRNSTFTITTAERTTNA